MIAAVSDGAVFYRRRGIGDADIPGLAASVLNHTVFQNRVAAVGLTIEKDCLPVAGCRFGRIGCEYHGAVLCALGFQGTHLTGSTDIQGDSAPQPHLRTRLYRQCRCLVGTLAYCHTGGNNVRTI